MTIYTDKVAISAFLWKKLRKLYEIFSGHYTRMRLGRHDSEELNIPETEVSEEILASAAEGEEKPEIDLRKLKKKDLLEIMLKQGEEIDRLRAQIADLEAKLEDRNFTFDKIGSIAEASLAVTDIFKEAEKAAVIYLENIRSRVK